MKWLMCLLAVFVLWMLLFWSADYAVIGVGVLFALIVGTLLRGIPGQSESAFSECLTGREHSRFIVRQAHAIDHCRPPLAPQPPVTSSPPSSRPAPRLVEEDTGVGQRCRLSPERTGCAGLALAQTEPP